jgi:hypothetical protein
VLVAAAVALAAPGCYPDYLVRSEHWADRASYDVIPAVAEKDASRRRRLLLTRSVYVAPDNTTRPPPARFTRVRGLGSAHPLWRSGAYWMLAGAILTTVGWAIITPGLKSQSESDATGYGIAGGLIATPGELILVLIAPIIWSVGAWRGRSIEVAE